MYRPETFNTLSISVNIWSGVGVWLDPGPNVQGYLDPQSIDFAWQQDQSMDGWTPRPIAAYGSFTEATHATVVTERRGVAMWMTGTESQDRERGYFT